MIHGQFVYRINENRFIIPAIFLGYGVTHLDIIHKGDRFVVVKKPGSGTVPGEYSPAQYIIMEIGLGEDRPLTRMIKYCEPGRWWKRWMKKYIEQAKDIEEIWRENPESYMVDIDERYGGGVEYAPVTVEWKGWHNSDPMGDIKNFIESGRSPV